MITFGIKCESPEEMAKLRDEMRFALSGSRAASDGEVCVCDCLNTDLLLAIGQPNDHDINYVVKQKDIKCTWRK